METHYHLRLVFLFTSFLILLGVGVFGYQRGWYVTPKVTTPSAREVVTTKEQEEVNRFEVKKTEVAPSTLPDGLPDNIPLEIGAKVLQNFNATTNDGRFQATRMFVTKKGLQENREIYARFFKENGWKVTAELSKPTYVVISGVKEPLDFLTVSVTENAIADVKTVELVYITKLSTKSK